MVLVKNNFMFIYAIVATTSEIVDFKIAENYFSDILNAQLVIFSVIVAALIAFYFLFNFKISKEQIRKEIEKISEDFKKAIQDENEAKIKELSENLAKKLVEHEDMITVLRGTVHRTLGQFWDSEKSYATAFIWWIRAAHNFSIAGEENLARLALGSARESVEKINFGYELNYDLIGEYQRLFAEINDKLYKIEKDLLDTAIKGTLSKKLEEKG